MDISAFPVKPKRKILPKCKNADDNQLLTSFVSYRKKTQSVMFGFVNFVYVISGKGTVRNCKTNEVFALHPGVILLRTPEAVTDLERVDDGTWLNFTVHASAAVSDMLVRLGFIENDMLCADIGDRPEHIDRIMEFYNYFSDEHGPQQILIAFLQLLFYFLERIGRDDEAEMLGKVVERLRDNLCSSVDVAQLAAELGTNISQLRKKFKGMYGCTITHYHILLRIEEAKKLLGNGHTVKQAAYELGYRDEYAFAHQFKQITGIAPGKYRKSIIPE